MSEIVYSSFVITALTFLILILSNWYIKHNDYKFIINALILSESFVLTFFFDKFTFFFGFSILLASFYYFSLSIKDASFNKNSQTLDSSFPEGLLLWFPGFGLFGIFSLLIYEYFAASNTVSANNILVILVSLSFIFYNKVDIKFSTERDIMVMFLFILSSLMLLPLLIFKLIYGYVGEDSGENWINSDIFIYNLLGLPLANFLSLFGYYVHASGTQIIFENLDTGLTQSVSVAESCSGITSIVVFFSLAISYLWVLNFKFDSNIALIILLGIMTSYIANLFRMSIIILAGHYRGMDALQFVHSYLGWFIFTIWMLIFWSFMDKLLNRDNYE